MPNVFTHLILAALVWTGSSLWSPGQCSEPGARPTPFAVDAARDPDLSLRMRWTIAPGTYLYRDKIAATDASGRELPVSTQPGETKDDPNFGPTEVYHGATEAIVPGAALSGVREVRVTYQAVPRRASATRRSTRSSRCPRQVRRRPPRRWQRTRSPSPTGACSRAISRASWRLFLGLGLLLAFTPCVLPMVPVLAGMLARSGERPSAGRGFVLSGTYVLAMALAYGTLGVAAAWSGRNLQVTLQTPVALGLLAAAFVALALSMFGVFDLALPSAVSGRLSRLSGRRFGALGAAAMGFTSALIVGPCVTPPLAAALLYVAQTGDVARGAAALFALGLGMGLPLIAFGTFGAGILPKSGPWLVAAKQAFGVVFVALAITMVSRLVPSEVTLVLWARWRSASARSSGRSTSSGRCRGPTEQGRRYRCRDLRLRPRRRRRERRD